MSRSYKKQPYIKDHNRGQKKLANRKVRNTPDISNGSYYKRVYQQWNICDYKWRWTLADAIQKYYSDIGKGLSNHKLPDLESYIKYWRKCVYYK